VRSYFILAGLAALVATSCGGEKGVGPGPDTTVATVMVAPPSATVDIGATTAFVATPRNAAGEPVTATVTWSSSAVATATVNSSGLVTGVAEGIATITALAGGRTGTAAVTVEDPFPPVAPSDVVAQPVSDTETDVSWRDNSTTESQFVIEREEVAATATASAATDSEHAPSATFGEIDRVDADVTTYRDTDLTPGTLYRYRVAACNDNGCSEMAGGGGPGEVRTWETLVLETAELPDGVVGVAYGEDLMASGGDGAPSWSMASGSLPSGLALSPEGSLSGTPAEAGTSVFEVRVEGGGQTVTGELSLTVLPQPEPPEVTTEALPDGGVGAVYTALLEATEGDGTYAWEVTAGGLPPGLALDPETGDIAGIPTEDGLFDVTVLVTSAELTGTADLAITVHAALQLLTSSLPDGKEGEDYQAQVDAEGGDDSNTFSVSAGSLPSGLALDPETGIISGTPSAPQTPPAAESHGEVPLPVVVTSDFTIQVENLLGQTASADLAIGIEEALRVTTTSLPGGTVALFYDQTLTATGGDGAYAWTIATGDLPNGLALDGGSGRISGTPTAQGTFSFRARVLDGLGDGASRNLSITIGSDVAFVPSFLVGGNVGVAYDDAVEPATGGDGIFVYELTGGDLPPGLVLNLDGAAPAIVGTPTEPGVHFFELTAHSVGGVDAAVFSVTVSNSGPEAFNLWGHSVATAVPTPAVQAAVTAAFAHWEQVVVGDVYDITDFPEDAFSAGECGGFGLVLNGRFFDDVSILLAIDDIDGDGQAGVNVVATAESCAVRGAQPDRFLPFAGRMTLDVHDLGQMDDARLLNLIRHQVAHVMGFGTEWGPDKHDLVEGAGLPSSAFTGSGAVAEWHDLGGAGNVPLETNWPTADTHWDEATFDAELMSSFFEDGEEYLSRLTIASMADLGWTVSFGAADAYALPACSPTCPEPAPSLAPSSVAPPSMAPPSMAPSLGHGSLPRMVDVPVRGSVLVLMPDGTRRVLPYHR
jgi:hypothetical protein